ncbi:MAG: 3-oxoacyl-[acyl-carrier-protein] synthase 3 [Syntrophus sp. SKADARSKE-3]|nr:3-oxoacyl-[acyl-carrier-protein] synthase 3 [Syntrophus sp. SKADARSKE-3]
MKKAVIFSTGSFLPDNIVTNESLTQFSVEARRLIAEKTGVQARRHASDTECTSDLALHAARNCLQKVGFPESDIEGIIVSTSSPDRMQPATATRVQHSLGASRAFAFDINSVCSGSTFGMAVADSLIRSEAYRNVLFIAAEMYSKILNPKDFSTYPFFGDGAGAILFVAGEDNHGVLHSCLATDGSKSDTICVPGGGTMMPFDRMTSSRSAYFKMKGEEVFAFTMDKGPQIIRQLIREADVSFEEIRCFICHQANINIIRGIADILEVPFNRFYINLDRYGNTASASVLIALDEAFSEGVVTKGDLIITAAFGGGLSWGANLIHI